MCDKEYLHDGRQLRDPTCCVQCGAGALSLRSVTTFWWVCKAWAQQRYRHGVALWEEDVGDDDVGDCDVGDDDDDDNVVGDMSAFK